jgi:hypothetical protein
MNALMEPYGEARQRIQERLSALASSWDGAAREKRVVCYDDGSGLSELGWSAFTEWGCTWSALWGHRRVPPCNRLSGQELAGERFDRLVVMSFRPAAAIRARLRRCGMPQGVAFWV